MYSTRPAYEEKMGDTIDKYDIREKVAVARLARVFPQFPLETEMVDLDESVAESVLLALYFQIKFERDNDLLDDNGGYTNVSIGNFSYSMNTATGSPQANNFYSQTAITLLKDTGLFGNRVRVKKDCTWLDGFTGCCQ